MRISAFFFAAVLFATGVAAHAAPPPRYYPAPDAPLTGEPLLAGIESAFAPGFPQPTLRLPLPETGARLATLDEFLTAFKTALAGNPANAAGIIRAARRVVRVSDGSAKNKTVAPDVAGLIAAAGEVPAVIPHFAEILDALLDEDPAETVVIASASIGAAARGGASSGDLRDMTRASAVALVHGFKPADAPYEELARGVLIEVEHGNLASAILTGLILGIRDLGAETIFLDDVMRGAARTFGKMPDVTIASLATTAFTQATVSRHHAILIAAGLVAGTPFFYLDSAISDAVAAAGAAALPPFAAEISAAASHARRVRMNEVKLAGQETLNRINRDGVNLSDAIVCAALMCADPKQSYDVLRAGFDATWGPAITPPAIPFLEWLRIVLSGSPPFAPDALGTVIARGNAEGLFVNGITPAAAAAMVLAANAPLSPKPVMQAAKKAIESGGAGDLPAQAGVLAAAIAGTPRPSDVAVIIEPLFAAVPAQKQAVLTSALLGVTDPSLRAAIAAAAVVADPANTAAHSATALAADPSVSDNAAIATAIAAAQQIGAVASEPKWKIAATMRGVISAQPGPTISAVFGALLAAPKQSLTIVAATLAADLGFDLETALALDPAHAAALAVAAKIAAAEMQDATDPGTTLAILFDTVGDAVLAHRTEVESTAAAAVIAAPRYAHHTLHAAAFRYPSVALASITAVFDAAPIASPGDQTARAAALAAGLINGLREARSGTKEAAQITLAVGRAVKAARKLTGPAVATSDGSAARTKNGPAAIVTGVVSQLVTSGDIKFGFGYILSAAVRKAPTHALSIAQAAAQAAASIGGADFKTGAIVNSIASAGSGFSAEQIRSAARFGKAQAQSEVAGAGATGVRNYEHRSGATDPLPSLEGL